MPPIHRGLIAGHPPEFSNSSTGIPTCNCRRLECPVVSLASPQGCVILLREKEDYHFHIYDEHVFSETEPHSLLAWKGFVLWWHICFLLNNWSHSNIKVHVKLANIHNLLEHCCFKQMMVCCPLKTCGSQHGVDTNHSLYLSYSQVQLQTHIPTRSYQASTIRILFYDLLHVQVDHPRGDRPPPQARSWFTWPSLSVKGF